VRKQKPSNATGMYVKYVPILTVTKDLERQKRTLERARALQKAADAKYRKEIQFLQQITQNELNVSSKQLAIQVTSRCILELKALKGGRTSTTN
jgi:hypothetical protein